jgi:uncharacterized protein YgbK (DUF1537 family)
MRSVAILADDLTGAVDTAAPFATEDASIRIAWRAEDDDDAAPMAFDTESRQVNAQTAEGRVRTALPWLRDAGTSKLDSLLRGNTLAELAVCATLGDFPRVVVAPAFAEQGRITRRGAQIVPEVAGAPPLAVDLAEALAGRGVPVRIVPRGEELPRRGVAICDAESLVATGEWAPGNPVARIVGGRWDGVRLVTKSGAFGDPDVLVRLLETATETPCA